MGVGTDVWQVCTSPTQPNIQQNFPTQPKSPHPNPLLHFQPSDMPHPHFTLKQSSVRLSQSPEESFMLTEMWDMLGMGRGWGRRPVPAIWAEWCWKLTPGKPTDRAPCVPCNANRQLARAKLSSGAQRLRIMTSTGSQQHTGGSPLSSPASPSTVPVICSHPYRNQAPTLGPSRAAT